MGVRLFKEEVGIKEIYRSPLEVSINNKKFYLGHGDGLGPGDRGYKIIKKAFEILYVNGYLHAFIQT